MICSLWVDQEMVESVFIPSNFYAVYLSTVCDAILGKGKLVFARRPSTISLVLEVHVFISISFWASQVSKYAK